MRGETGAARELRAQPSVHPATEADDEEIRALLRRRPMAGRIRLTFTREPRFLRAAEVEGERHHTVAVRAGDGALLGFGCRSVRPVYLWGKPTLVGYLGQMRSARGVRGIRRLRRAFEELRRTRRRDEAPFDLTAILEDNGAARRLLERGLPGLPAYRPLAEIRTLILPTGRRPQGEPAGALAPQQREAFLAFLHRTLSRQPLASVWRGEDFEPAGRLRDLSWEDVRVVEAEGRIVAAGALWDQRSFKQTRIAGYSPWLETLRPLVNLGLRSLGQPLLPASGSELPMAFVTALAVDGDRPDQGIRLLEELCLQGRRRGLDQLVLSYAQGHPLLPAVRRHFSARLVRSRLYAVCWEGEATLPGGLARGLPYLDAAFL